MRPTHRFESAAVAPPRACHFESAGPTLYCFSKSGYPSAPSVAAGTIHPPMTNRTKVTFSARFLPVALALGLAPRWTRL